MKFLAAVCITIETQCTIISITGNSAITKENYDLSFIAPSNHEDVDTGMLSHAKYASQLWMKKVLFRTVDTDIVAISIDAFAQMDLLEL